MIQTIEYKNSSSIEKELVFVLNFYFILTITFTACIILHLFYHILTQALFRKCSHLGHLNVNLHSTSSIVISYLFYSALHCTLFCSVSIPLFMTMMKFPELNIVGFHQRLTTTFTPSTSSSSSSSSLLLILGLCVHGLSAFLNASRIGLCLLNYLKTSVITE